MTQLSTRLAVAFAAIDAANARDPNAELVERGVGKPCSGCVRTPAQRRPRPSDVSSIFRTLVLG